MGDSLLGHKGGGEEPLLTILLAPKENSFLFFLFISYYSSLRDYVPFVGLLQINFCDSFLLDVHQFTCISIFATLDRNTFF